MYILSVI